MLIIKQDMQQMPKRQSTMVGERGMSLSGGQRARISLARAIYADSDIILMDDPLSAVDSKVGRYLFDKLVSLMFYTLCDIVNTSMITIEL